MDQLISPAFQIKNSTHSAPIPNPQNGEEYVMNVMFERRDCLETVTAEIDVEKLNKKQNIFIEELPKTISANKALLPTPEWQNCQEADFSELRCHISRLYNEKEVWRRSVVLPPINTDDSAILWTKFCQCNEPVLSLVFTMNQNTLECVLDILIECLNTVRVSQGIDQQVGKWLYAILASLKLPLVPNVCSSLRELARNCSKIRANLLPEDENALKTAAPLNLFICLVSRYFRQGDLAD